MPEQDVSGLGGGFSGANSPSSDESFSVGGQNQTTVLGTNQLQQAIDKFDAAVKKLTEVVDQLTGSGKSQFGGGGGSSTGNAGGASFGGGQQKQGFNLNKFASDTYSAATGSAGWYRGGSGGGNGSGFMGQHTIGGQPSGGGGQGGGVGAAIGQMTGIGGGGSSNGGGSSFGGMTTGAAAGAVATTLVGSAASFGARSLPTQMAMSNMQYSLLAMGTQNGGSARDQGDAIRAAAFGTHGTNLNNIALNAQDAANGYQIAAQMTGNSLPYTTSYGRNLFSYATSMGAMNPGLGWGGSMQMAQQTYSPQTSLRMQQLGYGATPLTMNGGSSSPAQLQQSIMQRWFGGQLNQNGAVDPSKLAATLAPGRGVGYYNLQTLGYSPDQISQMTTQMEGMNTLMSKGNMTAQQAQNVFNQYYSGNQQAKDTLSKYFSQNDLNAMKSAGASLTGQQSDIYDSFTSGLTDAATALGQFRNALDSILNIPGVNQAVGEGAGALGGLKSMANGSTLIQGAGLYGGAKIASSLLGKLGLGGGGAAAADGAGAGAAGLLSRLGPAALGLGAGIGVDWLGNKIGSATTRPGTAPNKAVGIGTDALAGAAMGAGFGSIIPGIGTLAGGVVGGVAGLGYGLIKSFLAEGGVVKQGMRGIDNQPAMLSKDEAVLNANASQALGYDVIDWLNRNYPAGGAGGRTVDMGGILYAASGAQILADAEKYKGHKYVYGGPSNPQGGWDCSSFASYVLGHDEGLQLPGGSWASTTNSGQQHGPVASQFKNLPGAHQVSHNAADIQAGDVLVWPTHVGFGVGPGTMFSAYDTAEGTLQTAKDLKNAGGPSGEQLTIMRYGAGGGTGAASGTGSSNSNSSSNSGPNTPAGTGGYNSTSEAQNVASALGASGSGVDLGVKSSTNGTGNNANTNSGSGSNYPAKSGNGIPQNAQAIANYLGNKGANKIAIAGILGNIMQESGGDPNAGSNPPGKGLIQILGDPGGTLQEDLARTWNYIVQNGGIGPVNAAKTASQAADIFSNQYERPGVPMLANREKYANAAYAAGYATGGTTPRSGPYIVGERGPEAAYLPAGTQIVDAARTRVSGAQGVAQVPWQAAQIGSGTSGQQPVQVNVNIATGAVQVNHTGTGALSKEAASNSAQELVRQVTLALGKQEVYAALQSGAKHG